jgi:hypothetical protein
MGIKYTNNSETTLIAPGITAGQTTNIPLAVGTGGRFPAVNFAVNGDYYYVTLVDVSGTREVIKVVLKTAGTDLLETVVRAADTIANSAGVASAFSAGDKVQCRLPAAAIMAPDGTTASTFQIDTDNTGITLKHDTQELHVRNLGDSAFADLKCKALTLAGALALGTNAISGVTTLAMGGALSGVTTLAMAGALSGVTTLAMAGTLTGATDITASGTITAEHLASTDDCAITDDLSVGGDFTLTGTMSGNIDNEAAAKTIVAGDHGTGSNYEVVNVVYGTGSAPGAGTVPEGTIWLKYV